MSRRGSDGPHGMNVLVGASLFILLLILAAGVFVGPPPSAPGQDGRRTGGIYDVPVLGQLAEGAADLWESFGGALKLATTPAGDEALVGIGAVVGYTGTTGESQVFTEWRQSGLLMSGVAIVDPLSGISVRPDNPRYRALKLYDEATGAEGEVWFQPIVAIRTVNGTPVSHSVAVAAKTILVCDNGAQEILSYNREVREGQGAPGQIQFSRHAAKGGMIYGKLTAALARGGAQGCKLQMLADYDAEILFEGDETPVRKSLSNIVLATFELRRVVPRGDFEIAVVSNATVRPLAEVMVGGEGGISGTTRTITFTETRVIVSTAPGATVTQTRTVARTETVVVASRTIVTVTQTVTHVVYAPPGAFAGVIITKPYDAFVFIGG